MADASTRTECGHDVGTFNRWAHSFVESRTVKSAGLDRASWVGCLRADSGRWKIPYGGCCGIQRGGGRAYGLLIWLTKRPGEIGGKLYGEQSHNWKRVSALTLCGERLGSLAFQASGYRIRQGPDVALHCNCAAAVSIQAGRSTAVKSRRRQRRQHGWLLWEQGDQEEKKFPRWQSPC